MSLLQMSISAGAMIVALVFIRALIIHHLPKRCLLLIWAIVAARLLVPFTWPSPLSIYGLIGQLEMGQSGGTMTVIKGPPPEFSAFDTPLETAAVISPWIWFWLAGAVICTSYFVLAYFRCRCWFRRGQPVENDVTRQWFTKHKYWRPVRIQEIDGIPAPLTYGFLKPVILMPAQTDWSDSENIQYILAHESVHIRRYDGIFKLILIAVLCIHWFNPLVWLMYLLANRDIELSCDEKVIQMYGSGVKSPYAIMLLDMEKKKSGPAPLCSNFSKNAVEERIVAIMNIKKYSFITLLVTALLVGGVTVVFATSAEPPTMTNVAISDETTVEPSIPKVPSQQELLADYGVYGITFDPDGKMLYNDEKIRYFCDGVEVGEGGWAIRYEYFNEAGTIDVFTKRNVIDKGDGSIDPFGPLTGLIQSSQQEFDQRDFSSTEETSTAVYDASASKETGRTFAEIFSEYKEYGITYEEEHPGSGSGNVFYQEQPVKCFIDETPNGSIFLYTSRDGGEITVHTLYDDKGKLLGIEQTIL